MTSKRLVLVVLVAVVTLIASVTAIASASTSPHVLTEITIEPAFHDLGDPDSKPEGSSWQGSFRIPGPVFQGSNTAHIEMYLLSSSNHRDSIRLNGRSFSLPGTGGLDQTDLPFISKTIMSIPMGVLKSGRNTITIEAGVFPDMGDNTHDDFEFGEVVLLLSN